ncbi:MAG: FAD-dependent oxidoreductase [Bacteroidota bacterium]
MTTFYYINYRTKMHYPILENSLLGPKLEKSRSYRIVGAGMAGLLLGFFFKRAGIDFQIVERSDRVGGLIGTERLKHGIAEQAANGFLWCPELQLVADELGLPLLPPKPSAKARFLLRQRQLRRFPLGPLETLQLVGRLLMPHFRRPQTVGEFGRQYLGPAFTRQLLAPGLAGIYGADIEQLSLAGALKPAAKLLNRSRYLPLALLKGWWASRRAPKAAKPPARGTHSFAGGMGALARALGEHLDDHILLNTDGLAYKEQKEPLVVTTPAPASRAFFDGELQELLGQVQYNAMISATFIFRRSALKQFKEGFGCLIPRNEGLNILGVLFNSCIFDQRVDSEELVSLTAILRDDQPGYPWFKMMDVDLKNLVHRDLDALFDINENPLDYTLFRWKTGIPIYTQELQRSWGQMNQLLQQQPHPRYLFGNYTGEISIRGMCQMAAKI